MPRYTETIAHSYTYGVDAELSFGQMLVKCLSFPHDEIMIDAQRAREAGVETGTTPERVAAARRQLAKSETTSRLRDERQTAARAAKRAA